MKTFDCIQGSPLWQQLRTGIPTASSFSSIVTPGGKKSKSAEKYMFRLLAERMMRHPVEEYISLMMQYGSETEKHAVGYYEFQKGVTTTPVGFMSNDAVTIGASPDRLVGDDGLLEAKCPKEEIHVSYMLQAGSAYEEYKVQCQGQLWIAGEQRKWVDVISYSPELPEAIYRVGRDEEFIAVMAGLVEAFSAELERMWADLVRRGLGRADWREAQ